MASPLGCNFFISNSSRYQTRHTPEICQINLSSLNFSTSSTVDKVIINHILVPFLLPVVNRDKFAANIHDFFDSLRSAATVFPSMINAA